MGQFLVFAISAVTSTSKTLASSKPHYDPLHTCTRARAHANTHTHSNTKAVSSVLWILQLLFPLWSALMYYADVQGTIFSLPCVEAGSNTSTVTLRVVGGDQKGSLKSETVKYGYESKGTRTQERLRWRVPAAYKKDRPVL
jgi:hypothetical protein